MGFTKLTTDLDVIQALSDRPNDNDGLDAAALKKKFDDAGDTIKTYINTTLIGELEASGAAAKIGIAQIGELAATTVQGALEALLAAITEWQGEGAVLNGSITTPKLANLAVTNEKLSELAVSTGKIQDSAVTTGKVNDGAVTTGKIANGAVTADKIAAAAVEHAALASNAVERANIKNGAVNAAKLATNAVTTDKIEGGAVTLAKTTGIQKAMTKTVATLTVSGWYQESGVWKYFKEITGFATDTDFITRLSDGTSYDRAKTANIRPAVATDGYLYFYADSKPSGDVTYTVYWW